MPRYDFAPPRPDHPAASVAHLSSAAPTRDHGHDVLRRLVDGRQAGRPERRSAHGPDHLQPQSYGERLRPDAELGQDQTWQANSIPESNMPRRSTRQNSYEAKSIWSTTQ